MVNFLRVAVASDDGERLDGDFMTSRCFLIYQVSPTELRLVAVRENAGGDNRNDRRQTRLRHIADCRMVYAKSISTPVSASLVAAGIHPVSVPKSMPPRAALAARALASANVKPGKTI
ncbi:MAG: NifB/NifX family molybdenum-iron cluster-binding protein [Methylococcaceae bacterium]